MQLAAGKNIRLFKNPILEQFTYVHPIIPAAVWLPVVILGYSYPIYNQQLSWASALALALAGLFIWTISEYALHRFVFHFKPIGPITERLAFLFHGIHHDDPEDARRLLMPPVAAIAIASVFYIAFTVTLGPVRANPFFAGFIFGYLCYDYTHFAVHFARPKSKFFKTLKQNHMLHHFVTPEKRFGVSNTFWDHVFRTHGS